MIYGVLQLRNFTSNAPRSSRLEAPWVDERRKTRPHMLSGVEEDIDADITEAFDFLELLANLFSVFVRLVQNNVKITI